MSIADKGPTAPVLGAPWSRLERAAEDAAVVVASWRRRAVEAEDELARLRRTLEEMASAEDGGDADRDEVRRLRAQNAVLHSRVTQARKRIGALLKRMDTLGADQ